MDLAILSSSNVLLGAAERFLSGLSGTIGSPSLRVEPLGYVATKTRNKVTKSLCGVLFIYFVPFIYSALIQP